jgi:hypothetical protein
VEFALKPEPAVRTRQGVAWAVPAISKPATRNVEMLITPALCRRSLPVTMRSHMASRRRGPCHWVPADSLID